MADLPSPLPTPKPPEETHILHERYGIGYKLLRRMGFQAGQGLGARSQGIAEPIGVTVLPSRIGLTDAVAQASRAPAPPGLLQPIFRGGNEGAAFSLQAPGEPADEVESSEDDFMDVSGPLDDIQAELEAKYAAELPEIKQEIQRGLEQLRNILKDQDEELIQSKYQSYMNELQTTSDLRSLENEPQGKVILDHFLSSFEPASTSDPEHGQEEVIDDFFASQFAAKLDRAANFRQASLGGFSELQDASARTTALVELARSPGRTPFYTVASLFKVTKQLALELVHQFSDGLIRDCGFGDIFCAVVAICARWQSSTWTILLLPSEKHDATWESKLFSVIDSHIEAFDEWLTFVSPFTTFQSHAFVGSIVQCCNQRIRHCFRDWKPYEIVPKLTKRDFTIGAILSRWSRYLPLDDVVVNTIIPNLKQSVNKFIEFQGLSPGSSREIVVWSLCWRRFIGHDCFDILLPLLQKVLSSRLGILDEQLAAAEIFAPIVHHFPDEMELFIRKMLVPSIADLLEQALPSDTSPPDEFLSLLRRASLVLISPQLLAEAVDLSGFFQRWEDILNSQLVRHHVDLERVRAWYASWRSGWRSLNLEESSKFRLFNLKILQILDLHLFGSSDLAIVVD